DRPDRTGMRPSICCEEPVPVSADGGACWEARARVDWMVNRVPPTELDVWIPVYVTPDCTDVPACSFTLLPPDRAYTLYCCAPATGVITTSTTWPAAHATDASVDFA